MAYDIIPLGNRQLAETRTGLTVIDAAGPKARRRTVEFFTAELENENTGRAYAHVTGRFLAWCDAQGLALGDPPARRSSTLNIQDDWRCEQCAGMPRCVLDRRTDEEAGIGLMLAKTKW